MISQRSIPKTHDGGTSPGRLPGRVRLVIELLVFGALASNVVLAADGVEEARQALKSTRQPWYDSDADDLRSFDFLTEQSAQRKDWRGVDRPEWDWNWNWPDMSWVGELFKFLAWVVLIGLIAVLLYALVKSFMDFESPLLGTQKSPQSGQDAVTDEQRIENLPLNLAKKKGDFLQMAKEHYDAGNFSEAIIYLFSYRLLQLARAGFIRLTKGKTNRQYLLEIRQSDELRRILGSTIVTFEDVFFGKYPLTQERFEGCWDRNEQFQSLISEAMS